jgi:hypothetical protein
MVPDALENIETRLESQKIVGIENLLVPQLRMQRATIENLRR